jgi:hypothetical protein
MHENREISCTSWSKDQDRSAKAINQTADMNVQEKSDCAVVPVDQPNKEEQLTAEAGEGRAQTKENIEEETRRGMAEGTGTTRQGFRATYTSHSGSQYERGSSMSKIAC